MKITQIKELEELIISKGYPSEKVKEIIKSIYKSEMPVDLAISIMKDSRFS